MADKAGHGRLKPVTLVDGQSCSNAVVGNRAVCGNAAARKHFATKQISVEPLESTGQPAKQNGGPAPADSCWVHRTIAVLER